MSRNFKRTAASKPTSDGVRFFGRGERGYWSPSRVERSPSVPAKALSSFSAASNTPASSKSTSVSHPALPPSIFYRAPAPPSVSEAGPSRPSYLSSQDRLVQKKKVMSDLKNVVSLARTASYRMRPRLHLLPCVIGGSGSMDRNQDGFSDVDVKPQLADLDDTDVHEYPTWRVGMFLALTNPRIITVIAESFAGSTFGPNSSSQRVQEQYQKRLSILDPSRLVNSDYGEPDWLQALEDPRRDVGLLDRDRGRKREWEEDRGAGTLRSPSQVLGEGRGKMDRDLFERKTEDVKELLVQASTVPDDRVYLERTRRERGEVASPDVDGNAKRGAVPVKLEAESQSCEINDEQRAELGVVTKWFGRSSIRTRRKT
ncbi:hypothetical protein GYMLUDRAFT_247966 [Collybiopsis luxurians FD-317 M1]|uniref:Unplaced genomic scaffold GYMLUscaffold_51, whole genome shotgun sequence n=1 Tax=Collybiopsis luxurians FD-317 M1 TaxID=944289 RepID=A0A0D0AZP3_9AGAR|nr:hypothetical protein GYMLUDRAFT_247966 [Collybiopsis luxurians FD-317 M1]